MTGNEVEKGVQEEEGQGLGKIRKTDVTLQEGPEVLTSTKTKQGMMEKLLFRCGLPPAMVKAGPAKARRGGNSRQAAGTRAPFLSLMATPLQSGSHPTGPC